MAEDRALVRNAADRKQVDTAKKQEALDRENELADLRSVLATVEGRRFIWRLMAQCKVFGTVFDNQSLAIAYNAGRQDVGHYLMSEVTTADEQRLLEMMKESQARELKRNRTVDATHTSPAAATQETTDDDAP
jgi:hypothetical protein